MIVKILINGESADPLDAKEAEQCRCTLIKAHEIMLAREGAV